jgi:hypothetical protein
MSFYQNLLTPGFPTPIGVFLDIARATYDDEVKMQIEKVVEKEGKGDLEKLLFSGNTWNINCRVNNKELRLSTNSFLFLTDKVL